MTTISRQYLPKRSFSNGVDNTTPIESPEIKNTLSTGLNVVMVDSDILKTRPGYVGITAAKSGYIIRNGIQYAKQDGTKEQIVYLESTTITGSSGILGRVVGDTIVNITTGLPDGLKPCMVQAGALLFVFTGVEDFLYDGTSTRQIGITEPSVAPSLNSLTSGNLNDGGFYVYVYKYRNSVTGAQSSPSLPSPTLTAGTQVLGTNGINIKVTPGDSDTADTIDIYRTASGGTTYFFEGSTTIDATSYTSQTSDAGLGDQLELDDSRLPEAATFAILADNRLFVGGFSSNKSRLQYSKIGINGTMFESFQIADLIDCNINDGEAVIGIGRVGTKIGVLKETKAGKLLPLDVSTGGIETGGSKKYIYKELNDICTSTSFSTIFSIGDKMAWLGRDNIYMTDGFEIKPVANRIRNTIRTFNFEQSYKFSVYEYLYPNQVILSVVRNGELEPDYQVVGHYINFPTIAWTMFGPGADPTTHPGLPIACIWSVTINGLQQPYFGSSNSNGKVCQYDVGTNDDGDPIYFLVKDQWEPGIDAMGIKGFQSVKYLATTLAASPNNILTNTWEENGREYVVKTEAATVASSTKWNSNKWGTFKWAGHKYSTIKFFPNRKAYIGRFGFYNTALDSPFSIKSMRLLYRQISE